MRVDAVFEGGGVKGIGLVGAIYYAETEKNVEWMNVAGTSAGVIVASLVAARYTAAEIKDIMFNDLDFNKIQDEGSLDRIPIIGKPMSVFLRMGFMRVNTSKILSPVNWPKRTSTHLRISLLKAKPFP